jgi:kynurenine formamidase
MTSHKHYIDLSVTIADGMPVYPGDPHVSIKTAGTFERDGYWGHEITMGNHVGTHIDAPAHMIEDGATLDQFDVTDFIGKACYVDARTGISLEAIRLAGPQPGDIVVFDTGYAQHFHEPKYFQDYPAMSKEVAEYLVSCRVKMVGLDTCSIDNSPNFEIHKILLGNNILVIENLTGLGKLRGMTAIIYALPLKVGIDASPARVIAEIGGTE